MNTIIIVILGIIIYFSIGVIITAFLDGRKDAFNPKEFNGEVGTANFTKGAMLVAYPFLLGLVFIVLAVRYLIVWPIKRLYQAVYNLSKPKK